jgi:hypothetical protein
MLKITARTGQHRSPGDGRPFPIMTAGRPGRCAITGSACIALAAGCLTMNHSLTSGFAACSFVVGSSSVSEFA